MKAISGKKFFPPIIIPRWKIAKHNDSSCDWLKSSGTLDQKTYICLSPFTINSNCLHMCCVKMLLKRDFIFGPASRKYTQIKPGSLKV